MRYLDALRELGIPVNWGTLLVGFVGVGIPNPVITPSEVLEQAYNMAAPRGAEAAFQRLVSSSTLDRDEIVESLKDLAAVEHRDAGFESRKWRLALLLERLETIPNDPIYGPLALTDFWSEFDFPPDSPHTIQGRGNSIHPRDYYSTSTLASLITAHETWIAHERRQLRAIGDTPATGTFETQDGS